MKIKSFENKKYLSRKNPEKKISAKTPQKTSPRPKPSTKNNKERSPIERGKPISKLKGIKETKRRTTSGLRIAPK
jgi:hypothetical protein